MSCHEIKELISAYIDGELQDQDSISVKNHISCCAECSAMLNDQYTISKMTADISQIDPPEGLMECILEKTTQRSSSMRSLLTYLTFNRIQKPVFASLILLAIGGLFMAYKPADVSNDLLSISIPNIVNESTEPIKSEPAIAATDIDKTITSKKANPVSIAGSVKKTSYKKTYTSRNKIRNRIESKTANIATKKPITKIKTKPSIEISKPADTIESVTNEVIIVKNDTDIKKDEKLIENKTELPIENKPAYASIRTAKVLIEERDNRLINESGALQDMRAKLKSRNANRRIESYNINTTENRKINIEIASMRF